MPLSLPNLDDRTYNDLVEEARARIPALAPEWTNHNASDPGVTLVELFAYLSESLIYRLNRVTDANVETFLRLIDPNWTPTPGRALAEEVGAAVRELRRPERAVTCEDFERRSLEAGAGAARARCVPERDLAAADPAARDAERRGWVSVVLVPRADVTAADFRDKTLPAVRLHLDSRRLLTTQVSVVGPVLVGFGVRLTLNLMPDAVEEDVRTRATAALARFFHELEGGREGAGWPFGRDVYVSEIYELLDGVPGVDFVTRTTDANNAQLDEIYPADPAQGARLVRNSANEVAQLTLAAYELPRWRADISAVTLARKSRF